MALTVPYSFTNGTIAEAGEVNSNFTAVKAFVDALQDGTGFDAGAIGETDIANGAVTAAKLADDAVTAKHCYCWFVHNSRYYGGCAGAHYGSGYW
jgi:N-formylglutamate amidohydrolase